LWMIWIVLPSLMIYRGNKLFLGFAITGKLGKRVGGQCGARNVSLY
jgi:hypothetical protein